METHKQKVHYEANGPHDFDLVINDCKICDGEGKIEKHGFMVPCQECAVDADNDN